MLTKNCENKLESKRFKVNWYMIIWNAIFGKLLYQGGEGSIVIK